MKYTANQISEWMEKAQRVNYWNFFDELFLLMYNRENFTEYTIHLNGGRKSGKTFNALNFASKAFLGLSSSCDVYLFRWKQQDTEHLFNEWEWHVKNLLNNQINKKAINLTKKQIKLNGNTSRAFGLHNGSNRKKIELTGLERAKGKNYSIIILEECYEFTDLEIQAIKHAVGGYNNFIFIYISNPNTLETPYLKRISEKVQHDPEQLKKCGYQFSEIDNVIYFYNNWRINYTMSAADIKTIADTWEIDENRAQVVDWGIPGTEAGVIYANEYNKIKVVPFSKLPSVKEVYIGIDWGDGSTETGSATAMIINGITRDEGSAVYAEYYHHNKNGYKTALQRADEMLTIIANTFEDNRLRPFKRQGVDIILDTGLYSEKEIMETRAEFRGMAGWLSFKFAAKNQERTRINIRKYEINTGRFIVVDTAKNLMQEIATQKWDETKKDRQGLPQQEDKNNHATDAQDYAKSYRLYDITDEDKFRFMFKH